MQSVEVNIPGANGKKMSESGHKENIQLRAREWRTPEGWNFIFFF